jgi:predicted nucleic acid-binding protein
MIIPLTLEISILAGEIRREYQIGLADASISATALKNGLIIVTNNVKNFEKVEGLKVLKPNYRKSSL